MPDPGVLIESVAAGGLCGGAVLLAGGGRRVDAITAPFGVAPEAIARSLRVRYFRDRLARDIERAGWHESPERAVVFVVALAACLAVLGLGSGSPLISGLGVAVGFGLPLLVLRGAIVRRRSRLEGELVPLLELFTLELSGGGGAISALGAVAMQVQGELAADLRRLLIASQVAGSASFESRLVEYSERLEIPAIASLATILAASREYGTGVVQGVRALATDLRRAQRRALIAHSRRALNHVLLPAAVGVLLPFLAILMFPAVTALQRNLR